MGSPSMFDVMATRQDLPLLSQLYDLFAYDFETGIVTRRKTVCSQPKGKVVGHVDDGYLMVGINRKRFFLHRVVWAMHYGKWPRLLIDHIDGNPLNNSIANLREVDHAINVQNQRPANRKSKTGAMGVRLERNKYLVVLQVKKRKLYFGRFESLEEAKAVHSAAKRKYHPGWTL